MSRERSGTEVARERPDDRTATSPDAIAQLLEQAGWAFKLRERLAESTLLVTALRTKHEEGGKHDQDGLLARAQRILDRGAAFQGEMDRLTGQVPGARATLVGEMAVVQALRSAETAEDIRAIDAALRTLRDEVDRRIDAARVELHRLERQLGPEGREISEEEPLEERIRRLRTARWRQLSDWIATLTARIDERSEQQLRQSGGQHTEWRSRSPRSVKHLLTRAEDLVAMRQTRKRG